MAVDADEKAFANRDALRGRRNLDCQQRLAGIRRPRIVGVDLSKPISLRRLKAILTRGDERIVAVSPFCGVFGLRRAMKAGADSLVLEEELEEMLVPAARAVAAGLTVMPADLWNGAEQVALSHREREVLRLAVTGRTNAEIASTLFLARARSSHISRRHTGSSGPAAATTRPR